jgi:uncharacterized protein YprB with RNaseH-like and TPR domain
MDLNPDDKDLLLKKLKERIGALSPDALEPDTPDEPSPDAPSALDLEKARQQILKRLQKQRTPTRSRAPRSSRSIQSPLSPPSTLSGWPPREDTTELEFFPCPRVELTKAAPGVEIQKENSEHPCYFINTPVSQLSDEMATLSARFHTHLLDPESPLHHWLPLRHSTIPFEPEHLLFLDLETTGLSNSPLFLVGAMVWENGDLTVKQYFARDFSEEAAAIAHFSRLVENRSFLVTFNGISFDVPYLNQRAATFGLPRPPFASHLDLLLLGRRIWGRRFGNCKLQTLEHHVCGRQRTGDIPGREIPAAYRAFVQTGNAWQVAAILEHNRLDLITLADLMTRLPFPQPPVLPTP